MVRDPSRRARTKLRSRASPAAPPGDWCIAIRDHDWHTGSAYYGLVAKENADGTFAVHYDDGHVQPDVRKDELRCLDRVVLVTGHKQAPLFK